MNKVVIFSTCVFLSACGSSGGDESSTEKSNSPTVNVDYSPIEGLYNSDIENKSGLTNVNRLYIANNGYLTAYNYQGDQVGTGDDCYTEASGKDVNSFYSGQKLSYDANSRQYKVSPNGDVGFDLAWEIDTSGNITQLILDSRVTSNLSIQSISDDNYKISVSIKKINETNADIVNKLCG